MAEDTGRIVVRSIGGERLWDLAPLETSPCTLACPTRINARGYVSLVSDGRFSEALSLIRERNPFPGVCGRVCPRPCEASCVRGKYDEPVAICALKRFVFDLEMKRGVRPAFTVPVRRDEKVAIVGAGPAGLSAARELALLGYPVTVFEAEDKPGGMMNLIPEFRLPRAVVRREVRTILDMGIELVTGTKFGKDVTWNQLKRRGYRALLVSTGAWRPAWKWGAAGTEGVIHAIDFLQNAALEIEDTRVAVAGSGMMALDCARTAIRLGAKSVLLILGTSRAAVSVPRDDLAQAEKEGVKTLFLARPSRLVTKGKKLVGIRCVKLSESPGDATGRHETVEISGSEFAGALDIFVDAYTRGIEGGPFASKLGLSISPVGTIVVRPADSSAGAKGIFAAGDLVTGPRSVVEAIASGQKAAYGIHQYLGGEAIRSPFDLTVDDAIEHREFTLEKRPGVKVPRETMPLETAASRSADFREVERGFPAQTARREAQRCLRCGPCGECTLCVDICEKKDVVLRVSDELSVSVHAGREFWSRVPERVMLELGDERAEANPLRTVCTVSEELCIGCGRCAAVCEYKAVQVEAKPGGRFIAHVDELACKGCGNCVTVCPTGAMDQRNFERGAMLKKLEGVSPSRTKVLFVCHWARPGRLDLPGDVLVIETMCAGRVTTQLIVEAVLRGSPRVLVAGCVADACHYGFGEANSARAVNRARAVLRLFGYKPEIVSEIATSPGEFALAVNKWAWKSK
jgi:NADPH-dependent glutamate synthase beta subunit-like oxidoreductase/coenzyme F420-reducing hydrogenase delta subunit/Pyruvate/2-oxoacid:ferredoxin oxidoreductase delta subunit